MVALESGQKNVLVFYSCGWMDRRLTFLCVGKLQKSTASYMRSQSLPWVGFDRIESKCNSRIPQYFETGDRSSTDKHRVASEGLKPVYTILGYLSVIDDASLSNPLAAFRKTNSSLKLGDLFYFILKLLRSKVVDMRLVDWNIKQIICFENLGGVFLWLCL